ncbi:uncharacterized protein LOC118190634 [Stegodyphus dumicola]|uniref:uncharacterized protein LOC118190634 n=1 Tax=Stegodyphus dumicola TaxID=202533 RepID=UPI0015AC404A|nr:uncharacterized protein LOC118190634 [Stegodyphus dumicola]
MFSIVIDIHRNILSAQCCVKYTVKNSVYRMEIEVNSYSLLISLFDDSLLCKQINIVTPSNFFIPMTFNCLEQQKNSTVKVETEDGAVCVKSSFKLQDILQDDISNSDLVLEAAFRLQISSDVVLKAIALDSDLSPSILEYFKKEVIPNVPYNILCTNCNTVLSSQPLTFKSIEEFPGEYSELSETWFCHKHPENHGTVLSNVLYISQMYFHLQNSTVDRLYSKKDHEEYKCLKCSSICTEHGIKSNSEFTKFFNDKIKFHAVASSTHSVVNYRNEIPTFSIVKHIESTLKSSFSCKLYLQNKVANEDSSLLLWVTSQTVAQFCLKGTSDTNKYSKSSDTDKCSKSPNTTNLVSEVFLKTKEMYKVLYCICSPSCDTVHSWKHDFNVDFYMVSDNAFENICQLLKESTKYIQNTQIPLNGFSLGYIPVHT